MVTADSDSGKYDLTVDQGRLGRVRHLERPASFGTTCTETYDAAPR